MVTIDLITGFLGSGKTTFLKKYARFLMEQGNHIGILEYDYGAVNVDMMLLAQLRGENCELEMVAAGCDTDCLLRRLRTKLISMAMSGYDRVILEPSGIFAMDRFFDVLSEEPLDAWYRLGSVITVVDAGLSIDDAASLRLLGAQAACAGAILFSRTQLTGEETKRKAKTLLSRATAMVGAKEKGIVYEKSWEELTAEDFAAIRDSGAFPEDFGRLPGSEDGDFDSMSFLNLPDDATALSEKIQAIFSAPATGVTRVKGFVEENGRWLEINATKNELSVKPIAEGQRVLIVIGSHLNKDDLRERFPGGIG